MVLASAGCTPTGAAGTANCGAPSAHFDRGPKSEARATFRAGYGLGRGMRDAPSSQEPRDSFAFPGSVWEVQKCKFAPTLRSDTVCSAALLESHLLAGGLSRLPANFKQSCLEIPLTY